MSERDLDSPIDPEKREEAEPERPHADDTGDRYESITISGGVVGAIGGRGHRIQQGAAAEPAPGPGGGPVPGYGPAAVRDLLLAAFAAEDLRRLFLYTANAELRPLTGEFGPSDGLADMVDRVIAFCRTRALFPDLLREVQRANPRQYAQFASRLGGDDLD